MGKIFVNYRRDDERAMAARVRDRLAQSFGNRKVFMDVDHLMAGLRFDHELEKALAETDVFLAVIGPRWMELLAARRASGERDYVHEEIAGALKAGIVVIPVLIDGAPLPRADELPEDLRELVLHQKHDVAYERFGRDMASLIEAIRYVRKRKLQEARGGKSGVSAGRLAAGFVLLGLIGGGGYVGYQGGFDGLIGSPETPLPAANSDVERRAAIAKAEAEKKVRDEAKRAAEQEAERKRQARLEEERQRKAEEARKRSEAEAKRVAEEQRRKEAVELALAVKPGSGNSFRDCADCPEMVVVPAGSFMMGSPKSEEGRRDDEGPQREVTFAKPFAVGKTAVTRSEYGAFVKQTGYKTDGGCYTWTGTEWKNHADKSWRDPGFKQDDKHPVVCVNWEDAKAYAAWLSEKTGKPYRLLSEAEWEYSARAGTATPFWWGSSIATSQANYHGNYTYGGSIKGEYRQRTVSADSFEPNPWGLYNVHGNVWEWSNDCWNDSYNGAPTDGSAWTSGDCGRRVVRGGSWSFSPLSLRSANRFGNGTGLRGDVFGFRIGRALTP